MPLTLKDLNVLPKKYEIYEMKHGAIVSNTWHEEGFNEAITLMEPIDIGEKVTLDREKLAVAVAQIRPSPFSVLPNKFDYEMADILISNLPSLLIKKEVG